jgi:small subunit ribosomal protein S1
LDQQEHPPVQGCSDRRRSGRHGSGIDEERRRISLGIKQCKANPGRVCQEPREGRACFRQHQVDHRLRYLHRLDGGIDGLVHLSDIAWNEPGEEAIRKFRKGDLVEAVILAVDAEGNRISLGIKQLQKDPFSDFTTANEKGAIVKGVVKAVDAKGATVELADGVEASLKASEIIRDRVEDASKHLTVGQEVEAKIISIDRKSRVISLSIKAKDEAEEREAISNLRNAPAGADGCRSAHHRRPDQGC